MFWQVDPIHMTAVLLLINQLCRIKAEKGYGNFLLQELHITVIIRKNLLPWITIFLFDKQMRKIFWCVIRHNGINFMKKQFNHIATIFISNITKIEFPLQLAIIFHYGMMDFIGTR